MERRWDWGSPRTSGSARSIQFPEVKKNGKPTAGEQSIEFWREQMRDLILQILAQTITRTLDQQIMVSSEIRDLQKGTNEGIIKLITIYETKK
jgi:hypothetical protein